MDIEDLSDASVVEQDGFAPLTPEAFAEWRDERDLGAAMLVGYAPQLAADLERFDVVAVEKWFSVPVRDPQKKRREKWDRGGVVDLALREKGTQRVWIMDHKTTDRSRLKDLFAVSNLEEQSSGYMSAYRTLSGIAPVGFIINALVKDFPRPPKMLKNGKGLSRDKDQTTTPELYRAAMTQYGLAEDYYAEFLAYLEANRKPFYARQLVTRTTAMLDDFETAFAANARERGRGFVYRNVSAMRCPWCPYKTLCDAAMSGVEDFGAIIAAGYDVRQSKVPRELEGKIAGKRETLSFSLMQDWKQCRQIDAYKRQGLFPKTQGRHLNFGTGIHSALASAYAGGDSLRVWEEFVAVDFKKTFGMTTFEAETRFAPEKSEGE